VTTPVSGNTRRVADRDSGLGAGWEDDRGAITQAMATALADPHDGVGGMVHYLSAKPGKLLRPQLVMAIARRLGCRDDESIRRSRVAAAAVELLHLGSLYHDDVMDEARLRRGIESANARFSNLQAVLAGDIVLAASSMLAAGLGRTEYALMAHGLAELCRGQLLETLAIGRLDVTEDEYLETVRGKTASLLGVAATMACMQADAGDEVTSSIRGALEEIGIAFQMLDDLVDLIGPEGVSGKSPGQDLREGVVTLPAIRALELDAGFADALREVLGTAISSDDVATFARSVIESGAAADVLDRVRTAEERGRAQLTAQLGDSFARVVSEQILWTPVVRRTLDARGLGRRAS
jgi:heptaprenyl diphosphate synthase